MTQVGYWSSIGFPVGDEGILINSGYQGTLGFELPTAIGAQAAAPNRPVVAIVGDGGFMYGASELSTAVQYGLNVIAIVFNDGAFGNVRRIQRRRFGRVIGSELQNPNFVGLADSFGAWSTRVSDPDGLRAALEAAIDARRPAVIDVTCGEMDDPLPLLMR
jgi:acetolactate synthase-1/2/3 large subunit